jgi:hypothetical protein
VIISKVSSSLIIRSITKESIAQSQNSCTDFSSLNGYFFDSNHDINVTETGFPVALILWINCCIVRFFSSISFSNLSKTKIIQSATAFIASKFFNHSGVSIFAMIFIFHLLLSFKKDFNIKISSGDFTPESAIIWIPCSTHRKISF